MEKKSLPRINTDASPPNPLSAGGEGENDTFSNVSVPGFSFVFLFLFAKREATRETGVRGDLVKDTLLNAIIILGKVIGYSNQRLSDPMVIGSL